MEKDLSPTEQAILLAADQEFMTKGFAGARTTAIAQKAGVTHAMLHYYFRTKEQLFEKVVDNKIALVMDSFGNLLTENNRQYESIDIRDWIASFVGTHFDFVAANPDLVLFVISELKNNPEKMKYWLQEVGKLIETVGTAVQSLFDYAATKGKIGKISFATFASDMISLNVMSVTMADVASKLLGVAIDDYLAARKEENILLMQKRLLS